MSALWARGLRESCWRWSCGGKARPCCCSKAAERMWKMARRSLIGARSWVCRIVASRRGVFAPKVERQRAGVGRSKPSMRATSPRATGLRRVVGRCRRRSLIRSTSERCSRKEWAALSVRMRGFGASCGVRRHGSMTWKRISRAGLPSRDLRRFMRRRSKAMECRFGCMQTASNC